MPTFTTVDAAWTPSPTTFDDAEARRFDTAMFLGDGTANGVRGGVVRHGDTSLAVTVNGSDQVTVQPGAFVIPAATGLGVYRGALSAAVGPTAGTALSARNATNPRVDLVVIQATSTGAVVKTIDGTPSSSPSAPALPAQHIEVARLTVPQVGGGAVTVDSTFRAYATGLGGDLYVETSARLPGSGNQKGQRAIALDTGLAHLWTGVAWMLENGWQTTSASFPNLPISGGTMRYSVVGKTCHFRASATVTGAAGPFWMDLPVQAALSAGIINSTVWATDQGTGYHAGVATLRNATSISFLSIAPATGNTWAATVPFTWANTDSIIVTGTYEIA